MGQKKSMKLPAFEKQLLKAKFIGIDTSCFIYLFEQNPQFEPLCRLLFNLAGNNKISLITSVISLTEVLVKPKQKNDQEMASNYQSIFLETPNLRVCQLDFSSACLAAQLKANYNLGLADASQIAICQQNGAKIFVSNDIKLKKVKEIKVLILKDYA